VDDRQKYIHISDPAANGKADRLFAAWRRSVQMLLPRPLSLRCIHSTCTNRRCQPSLFHLVQHIHDFSSVQLTAAVRPACKPTGSLRERLPQELRPWRWSQHWCECGRRLRPLWIDAHGLGCWLFALDI